MLTTFLTFANIAHPSVSSPPSPSLGPVHSATWNLNPMGWDIRIGINSGGWISTRRERWFLRGMLSGCFDVRMDGDLELNVRLGHSLKTTSIARVWSDIQRRIE